MENVMDENIVIDESRLAVVSELMRNVYLWMTGGLALTGALAWIVANTPEVPAVIFGSQAVLWGLIIAEFVLVLVLTMAINKMSFTTAAIMYVLYSALNGVTLSSIFLIYELDSIGQVFFVTAGAFAILAFIGSVTKKDLSGLGTFLIISLAGLIIASIVGMIMGRPDSIWISALGVLIFAGLTVYDAQKIRLMMLNQETVNEGNMKLALLGALSLYLDFINLLLRLLSLFGKRK
ncbi:MAG: Bax inhibitor-1/YccA family protein [Paludibacteraceae bacterium]|nr:Bax inhibitor-1/YccA family protein [Paludibacteraceae bacterium]